jgi:multimeric flavodoxin WrbA
MKEVYSGFEWADAILIGTPVYQGTLSGQAKVVLDRMRAFAASNPHGLRGKIGAAVADGGVRTSVPPSGRRIKVQMVLKRIKKV